MQVKQIHIESFNVANDHYMYLLRDTHQPNKGGHVMTKASNQTPRIISMANRLQRHFLEYVNGCVTARYLSRGQ